MATRPLVGQKHKGLLKYPPHSSNALAITRNAGNSAHADKRPTKQQETPSMHKKTRGLLKNRNSSLAPPSTPFPSRQLLQALFRAEECEKEGRRVCRAPHLTRLAQAPLGGLSDHKDPLFFSFFFSAARRKCVLSASARENSEPWNALYSWHLAYLRASCTLGTAHAALIQKKKRKKKHLHVWPTLRVASFASSRGGLVHESLGTIPSLASRRISIKGTEN